jgi:hypothetical protein
MEMIRYELRNLRTYCCLSPDVSTTERFSLDSALPVRALSCGRVSPL